jgi:hypothetical protein
MFYAGNRESYFELARPLAIQHPASGQTFESNVPAERQALHGGVLKTYRYLLMLDR